MIIQREKPAHWYGWNKETQQAYPVHEVPYKDPAKGMRATTLADAKKLNLMKSVTAVCHQLNKPGLESWKQEQLILSALTMPRAMQPADQWWAQCITELGAAAHDGEVVAYWCANHPRKPIDTDDVWAHRIIEDADAQAEKARDEGLEIHQFAQMILEGKMRGEFYDTYGWSNEMVKLMQPFQKWVDTVVEDVLATEELVSSTELGVAGREDAIIMINGRRTYMDIKGQDVKDGKPTFYPEWLWQLAGYATLDARPEVNLGAISNNLISVVIDRKTGAVFEKIWSKEEAEQGTEMFRLLNRMWDIRNNHSFKL